MGMVTSGDGGGSGGTNGVSNTPIVMENAELDEGYPPHGGGGAGGGENGEQSPSNLPSSTTNEGEMAVTKMEHPIKHVQAVAVQDPLQPGSTTQEQNGVADWIGGPITTIADTLGGAMSAAGIDPLQQDDPFN